MTKNINTRGLAVLLVLASTPGCAPSRIIGPLSHQQEERSQIRKRATAAGTSLDTLDKVMPPLTADEERLARHEDNSCRSRYMWKNGLTWTGSVLVGVAAGVTIGAAYATSLDNRTGKLIFGVSAGTLAALGSLFVATGGVMQQRFTDHRCITKARLPKHDDL